MPTKTKSGTRYDLDAIEQTTPPKAKAERQQAPPFLAAPLSTFVEHPEENLRLQQQNDSLARQVQALEHAKSLAAVQTAQNLRKIRSRQEQLKREAQQACQRAKEIQVDLTFQALSKPELLGPFAKKPAPTDARMVEQPEVQAPSGDLAPQSSAPLPEPPPQPPPQEPRASLVTHERALPPPRSQAPAEVTVATAQPPAPGQLPMSTLAGSLPAQAPLLDDSRLRTARKSKGQRIRDGRDKNEEVQPRTPPRPQSPQPPTPQPPTPQPPTPQPQPPQPVQLPQPPQLWASASAFAGGVASASSAGGVTAAKEAEQKAVKPTSFVEQPLWSQEAWQSLPSSPATQWEVPVRLDQDRAGRGDSRVASGKLFRDSSLKAALQDGGVPAAPDGADLDAHALNFELTPTPRVDGMQHDVMVMSSQDLTAQLSPRPFGESSQRLQAPAAPEQAPHVDTHGNPFGLAPVSLDLSDEQAMPSPNGHDRSTLEQAEELHAGAADWHSTQMALESWGATTVVVNVGAASTILAANGAAVAHERVSVGSARGGAASPRGAAAADAVGTAHSGAPASAPNSAASPAKASSQIPATAGSPADAAAGAAAEPADKPRASRREQSSDAPGRSARGQREQRLSHSGSSKAPLEEFQSEELQAELEECTDTIRWCAESVTRESLQDLKNSSRPPDVVRDVLEVVALLIGQPETRWDRLRRLISSNVFLERVQRLNFQQSVTREQFKQLRERLQHPDFDEELIKTVCVPVVPLAMWCRAIGVYLSKTKFKGGPEIRPVAGAGAASPPAQQTARPVMQLPGEYMIFEPDLESLSAEELRHVQNLTISRPAVGSITFHGETDCSELDFERIVRLEIGEVLVYPDASTKPPVGVALNKPATVTMYQCWPPNGSKLLHDPRSQERYRRKIQQMTEGKHARFIDYDCTTGVWQFGVDHF